MTGIFYPNDGALVLASVMQTDLQGGAVRLFQSTFSPETTTTLAELVAAEADFTGYPAGGFAASVFDPALYPLGGASITLATVQFETADPTTDGNLIGGWFLVDANGDLVAIGVFPNAQPMQVPHQALPVSITLVYGNSLQP